MTIDVELTASGHRVTYSDITSARIDHSGNLRLYRRGRLFQRQDVFHPAGEWWELRQWLHAPAPARLPGRKKIETANSWR